MMERFAISVLIVHCKMMEMKEAKAGGRSQIILDGISCFLLATVETMAKNDLRESFFCLLVSEI